MTLPRATSHHLAPLPPPHLLPAHPSLVGASIRTQSNLTTHTTKTDKTMPPPSFLPRKRKLAMALSSPSPSASASPTPDAEDADDDDYAPVVPVAGPSKRATKASSSTNSTAAKGTAAGGGGRALSREQLRKANHSMIERRRREKINAALAELRDMVPGLGGETKGGEFKLEVLEQTVQYMKELKQRIEELESASLGPSTKDSEEDVALGTNTTVTTEKRSKATKSHATMRNHERIVESTDNFSSPDLPLDKTRLPAIPIFPLPHKSKASTTPPSPSSSPDPNETEPETNLPPAYTLSARHSTPSITSLLQSANSDYRPPTSRPIPSAQATNPTLYLPFPTPSPTSPFLTYNNTSSSSSGSSGPAEPSPFIAPLQSIPLFGGALNLDQPDMPKKDLKAEEAANLLLAFSSPDTLHPVNGLGMGMGTGLTPKMVPVNGGLVGGKRERRGTLESDEFDFVLDGGVRDSMGRTASAGGPGRNGVVGKTARDILKM